MAPATFMRMYRIQSESVPDYDLDDFAEAYWLTPAEVMDCIHQGECAKDDLPRLLACCYGDRMPLETRG